MEFQLHPSPRLRTAKSVFDGGVRGEWTPTISSETVGNLSVVYGTRTASYHRIGDILVLNFFIGFTPTFTTASGALLIQGRPYFDKVFESVTGPVGTSRIILTASYTFLSLSAVATLDKLVLEEHGSNQLSQNVQINTGCTSAVTHNIHGSLVCRIKDAS